ncbi:MAG: DUF1028 domain-containing protein [Burkholderiales bacterium]|jgi:uncharacterized Ntn-hydrolase superfamily protein|nr:DUF1028 domain-containing protein [Burkholderiales bacterium]
MTWSILARDASGAFGIAIASRFFAVGALCPHAQSGAGALSTQALMNPLYGKPGLAMLASGKPAPEVVRALVADDEGRDHRQVHAIDAQGRVGAHTGAACLGWCGHLAGRGWSLAGNMLAGAEVLEASAFAYERLASLPFAERLLGALDAGEAAGGDKRGKQAAALLVVTTEDYPALTLRVDDHAEPLAELRRLHEKSLERFVPFTACLATRARPSGITDRAVIEAEVERFHAAQSAREPR